jgi:quinolinate synthase
MTNLILGADVPFRQNKQWHVAQATWSMIMLVFMTSKSKTHISEEILVLKKELSDRVAIFAHHYQCDDIVQFADAVGDSLELAKKSQNELRPFIVFCGVHFMAELSVMLGNPDQKVIMPDPEAGCSMADFAPIHEVEAAWKILSSGTSSKIIPVTYVNSSALVKAFTGRNGGSLCTSANANKIIEWAFSKGQKLFFLPDQHLGRNTCFKMGIPLAQIVVFNPGLPSGGLSKKEIEAARVILWYGSCCVHQEFSSEQVTALRKKDSSFKIVVHPECDFDTVQAADFSGPTSIIMKTIEAAPAGGKWAIGTEINLVSRLAKNHPDKTIIPLSPTQCRCKTMQMTTPEKLLNTLLQIRNGRPPNGITVAQDCRRDALKATQLMLSLS